MSQESDWPEGRVADDGRFPKAKSLVGQPLAVYDGTLTVGGRTIDVAGWVGNQNHNWGSQHTDRYAWGQVAGFDEAPDSFLEVATAWLRFGQETLTSGHRAAFEILSDPEGE